MKKILLFISILLIAGSLQAQKFTGTMVMPGSTTAFGITLPVGAPIYQKVTGVWYISDSIVAKTKTITTALSAGHIHRVVSADTAANKRYAAYYTTTAALALKAAKADTGANKKNAAYFDMTTKLALKQTKVIPDTSSSDPLWVIGKNGGHLYFHVSLTGAIGVRWLQLDN